MPDLIYNVKFEIDDASKEKIGKALDSSSSKGIKQMSESTKNLNNEIQRVGNSSENTEKDIKGLTNAVSQNSRVVQDNAKKTRAAAQSQKNLGNVAGQNNKTFAAGNQAVLSFGDLVQDSTQFSYGFASGMRAIGNNIGFTAELLAIMSVKAKAAGVSLKTALMSSLKGINGIVLGINIAVTILTVVLEKFRKKQKESASATEEATKKLKEQDLAFKAVKSSGDSYLMFVSEFVSELDKANKVLVPQDVALLQSLGNVSLSTQKLLIEEEINRLQLLEQESGLERQRLNNEIATLKAKKGFISLSRTSTLISEQEVAAIAQKNQLSKDIEEVEQRLARLDAQKKDRAEEIAQYQKEQIKLGEKLAAQEQARIAAIERGRPFIQPDINEEKIIDNIQELMETMGLNVKPLVFPVEFEPEETDMVNFVERIDAVKDPLSFVSIPVSPDMESFESQVQAYFKTYQVPRELLESFSEIESIIGDVDLSFIDDPSLTFGTLQSDLAIMKDLQDDFNAAVLDSERELIAEKIKIKKKEINSKQALLNEEEKNNKSSLKAIAQTAANILPSLFEDQKASAIASALVNAGSAIVRQYADLPLAAAIPASIATAVATKKQIEQIKKTNFGDTGGSVGGGGVTGGISPISSSASGVSQPTQSITFLPNAATSGGAPPTVDVKIDRAGLAVAVNKGNRELANKQVRV